MEKIIIKNIYPDYDYPEDYIMITNVGTFTITEKELKKLKKMLEDLV